MSTPQTEWDGHLITIAGGFLIDASCADFRYPEHELPLRWLPNVAIVSALTGQVGTIGGTRLPVMAVLASPADLSARCIWFANPENRGWKSATGTALQCRRPITEALLAAYRLTGCDGNDTSSS
jgi:hypothetical protein